MFIFWPVTDPYKVVKWGQSVKSKNKQYKVD